MSQKNIPITIGRFQIISELGSGGMGIVYKAIDPTIEQTVALKVIRPERLQKDLTGNLLKRFRNEVLASRRLRNEHIVATFDYQEEKQQGLYFIIMELAEGKLLSKYLEAGEYFDMSMIMKIMDQLLTALDHAHSKGVIHRDIKPDNIIIRDDGNIQVMDFGIAKLDDTSMTQMGDIMGSPGYMSPEQCQEHEIDKTTDIFSSGVILYQLLTKEKPFAGDKLNIILQKTIFKDPPKPSSINPNIPEKLDKIVAKAIAKKPAKRFKSAKEFHSALAEISFDDNKMANASKVLQTPKPKFKIASTMLFVTALISCLFIFSDNLVALFNSQQKNKVAITVPVPLTAPSKPLVQSKSENVLNDVLSIFQQFDCNTLSINKAPYGIYSVKGSVLPKDIETINSQLIKLFDKTKYQSDIQALKKPLCEVINLITPFDKNNRQQGGIVQIAPYNHSKQYVKGENIRLEIITPKYPVYLYADYFADDGSLFHLFPSNSKENTLNEGHQRYILGDNEVSFEVAPPYGKDLITLIASREPLFDSIQDENPNTNEYISKLSRALETIAPEKIVADYFFLNTGPVAETNNE